MESDQSTPMALQDTSDLNKIRRTLAAHVADGTSSCAGSTTFNLANKYTDQAQWQNEREKIFRGMPIFAGLSIQLPNAGDVLLFDHAGPAIIIIRSKQGHLSAFLNMCTHRAARLLDKCERVSRLTCPFHAWSFDLEGRLKGVPGKEFFEPETLRGRDLIKVPVAEWHGMIFVRADPDGDAIDVETHLQGYAEHLRDLGLDRAVLSGDGRIDVDSNWKFTLDTLSESYHLPALHTKSFGLNFYPNLIHYDRDGPHHRFAIASKDFSETVGKNEGEWNSPSMVILTLIFPNLVISLVPLSTGRHAAQIHRVFPGVSVGQSFHLTTTVALPGASSDIEIEEARETHKSVIIINKEEDYSLAANAQQNLLYAPRDFTVAYGPIEPGLQDFHKEIATITGGG